MLVNDIDLTVQVNGVLEELRPQQRVAMEKQHRWVERHTLELIRSK